MNLSLPMDLLDFFRCDPETGVITRTRDSGNAKAGSAFKPVLLRGRSRQGYLVFRFRRRDYAYHRVVWFLCTGHQPPPMLDHADAEPSNNSLSNLRPATSGENNVNRRGRRDLPKGVYPAGKRFRAAAKINYRTVCLGTHDTVEEASQAYLSAVRAHYGEFARAR